MRNAAPLLAACLLAASGAASGSPGDVVVPAHRTKDGHYVPANVPPLSGGTHLAKRPARGAPASRQATSARPAPHLPPLLVEAQPIRR